MEVSLFDGREENEHRSVGFTELSQIFAMHDDFFLQNKNSRQSIQSELSTLTSLGGGLKHNVFYLTCRVMSCFKAIYLSVLTLVIRQ